MKNGRGCRLVAGWLGSALSELHVPARLRVDQDAAGVAAVVGEAGPDEVHVPRDVLHRVDGAVDGHDAAARADVGLEVGVLDGGEPGAPRPTVESKTIVLYCMSAAMSSSGLVGRETPAGACRPGFWLMFGSQMSTSKPFSVPSFWIIASMSTIDWWRKPPERPLTRILYVAAGVGRERAWGSRTPGGPGHPGPPVRRSRRFQPCRPSRP